MMRDGTVLVKVGMDRRHTRLYLRESDFPLLEERGYGIGAGKSASVVVGGGRIDVMPSSCGPRFSRADAKMAGEGWAFKLHDEGRSAVRCHAFVAEARLSGLRLCIALPPAHLLPWPKEYGEGARDDVIEDLRVRMDAAEEATGRRAVTVPGNVLERLSDQEQLRLFREWRV